MLFLKRSVFIFFVFYCCLFFGCKNDSTLPDDRGDAITPPVVIEPTDNVMFANQTDFVVKVFSDSLKTNLISEMNARSSDSYKVDVSASGNVFYYTYYLPLGNVLIPYGTDEGVAYLTQDQLVTLNIVEPTKINTNKNIALIENLSTSAIVLGYGNNELLPENKTTTLLNQNEYGVYILDSSENLADYKIVDAGSTVPLSDSKTTDKGYIYSFIYTGDDVVLISKSFLDLSLQEKIWKISLSQDYGKTLLAGHFTRRANLDNGYMLFGRQVFSNDEDLIDDSTAYYAFINSQGEILDEQNFSFIDEPRNTKPRRVVDTGNYILACGEKLSSENITSAFVMGIEGRSVYKDIWVGTETVLVSPQTMIQKKDDTFCVLVYTENYSSSEWTTETYISSGIVLVEVTSDSYTSLTTKELWRSDENQSLVCWDLLYDETTDTYVVLSWNEKDENNVVSFIDATSGTQKFDDVMLPYYDFTKLCIGLEGRILLCGAFINQVTGSREACIMELDVSAGTLADVPKTFPSETKNFGSFFNDVLVKDDHLILVGRTDYSDCDLFTDAVPYLVAYDISQNKILWERKLKDLVGYEVFSCNVSDVNFIYELYNQKTLHSYIVSAGLLGEIPEDTKLTLPHSSSIKEVEAPDVSVCFYESADSQEGDYYDEAVFKYGETIMFDDLADYEPTTIPSGYEVTGWYEWGIEAKELVFPIKFIAISAALYPKVGLAAPALSGYATSGYSVSLSWTTNPAATRYDIYIDGEFYDSTTSTNLEVQYLNSETTYSFSVCAYDGSLTSSFSNILEVTTPYFSNSLTGNPSQIPTGAEELSEEGILGYLESGKTDYYYVHLESGQVYEVIWADSYEGAEEFDYTPKADIKVSIYCAGETETSNYICNQQDNGYNSPVQIIPSAGGYYVIEVTGYSTSSSGYYIMGYYES